MRFILQKRYLAIQITLRERHSSSLLSQDTGRRRKKNRKITRPRHSDAPISTYISLEGKTKKRLLRSFFSIAYIIGEKRYNKPTTMQIIAWFFSLPSLSSARARALTRSSILLIQHCLLSVSSFK